MTIIIHKQIRRHAISKRLLLLMKANNNDSTSFLASSSIVINFTLSNSDAQTQSLNNRIRRTVISLSHRYSYNNEALNLRDGFTILHTAVSPLVSQSADASNSLKLKHPADILHTPSSTTIPSETTPTSQILTNTNLIHDATTAITRPLPVQKLTGVAAPDPFQPSSSTRKIGENKLLSARARASPYAKPGAAAGGSGGVLGKKGMPTKKTRVVFFFLRWMAGW
ncbi:hypothetical protein I316_00375 [Kwoniella heveanensis BCC8398]|uniref:Uncharacterized protein n=1 Tax=Kwoniella heveanensis BCC8398 TaxID=1296120 RepID=A0A1B9H4F5_9TREE|nr:hypothetical protein I316_00375 [Kwoniella heveanensis BCC8398]